MSKVQWQHDPTGVPAVIDEVEFASIQDVPRAWLFVVNVNPLYTVPKLEHRLLDADVAVVVVPENFAHTLQAVPERNPTLKPVVVTTQVGDRLPTFKELVTNVVAKYVKHLVLPWTTCP